MKRTNWSDDKILFRLLTNKSDKTRWDNIRALRQRPSDQLFTKCAELAKSNNQKEQLVGIDVLSQLGTSPRPYLQKTLTLYFNLLNTEPDSKVLKSLLYAISHNNTDFTNEQIDKLCSFINNKNPSVKEGLTFALLGIDDLKAIDVLIKLSAYRLSSIRKWATFGLSSQIEQNNSLIRDALWSRVNDKHQETRLEAIFGLAKHKDERVKDIIKRELAAGEYGSLLFSAIIETGDEGYLPLLHQTLQNSKQDTTVNSEWIDELEHCISALSKPTNQ